MSEIQKKYFTTSEIARICGVTKHTLFHYDEIGLLRPEFVNEKGYRFYSLHQCYTLEIINVLKKAGSSLQEIKHFFEHQNATMFVNLIKQKQKELEIELLKIKEMQNLLDGAIEMTEAAKQDLIKEPLIEACEAEEYFIATQLEAAEDELDFASKLVEHRSYCEEHLIIREFSVTTIILKSRFESGDNYPNFIASKIKSPLQDEKIMIKPKGLYAVIDHVGSYESMSITYHRLREFIGRSGMNVTGNVYERELLNYFNEKNPDNFIIRISAGVGAG